MQQLLEKFNRLPAATDSAITDNETRLGVKLPEDYVEFLQLTNGGEGFIGENSYVILWGIEELGAMNQDYEVEENAPGLLIFGTDGGGEAYGFDTRTQPWSVAQVPFIGMSWEDAWPMGESFTAFMQKLYGAK